MFKVFIADAETGEVRSFIENFVWTKNEAHNWSREGHFGCNCQREFFFRRIEGRPAAEEHTQRYYVVVCTALDGEVLFADDNIEDDAAVLEIIAKGSVVH